MPTIKGPIKFGPNSKNTEVIEKINESGAAVKLPFNATGFKSSKMPFDKNKIKGIEFADEKYDLNRDGVVDEKDVSLAAKVLAKSKRKPKKSKGKK